MAILVLGGCVGSSAPVAIDTRNDACDHCRMIVSDPRLAAEIVTPGDEPRIFDDLGCLRDYLTASPIARDAVVYVADHQTGDWVRASDAVFTRVAAVATPMGSHLLAHASVASRDADPQARGGETVDPSAVIQLARMP
jgi:copper chaperone NosL